MVDAAGTTRYTDDAAGQLLTEDDPWENDVVSNTCSNRLRLRMSLAAPSGGSANAFSYAYDEVRRLTNVTSSAAGSFGYECTGAVQQQVTYTRGRDLSGTLEGAGGIGGLLARTSLANSQATTSDYHCDGNGNVTCLVNSNQLVVASYAYDSFGTLLRQESNLYRFSSKEWHENSGLVYYLYRFCDPGLQRWPNRDPIEEAGGINLYRFSRDNPISEFDPDGPASGKFAGDCYLCALGCPIGSPRPNGKPVPPQYGAWPGMFDDPPQKSPNKVTCDEIVKRIQSDFKGDSKVEPPPKGGDCSKGYHRIGIEIGAGGFGYHFKRKDQGGNWSEKPSDFEDPGPCNPKEAMQDNDGNPYTQCPDDLCVPEGSK